MGPVGPDGVEDPKQTGRRAACCGLRQLQPEGKNDRRFSPGRGPGGEFTEITTEGFAEAKGSCNLVAMEPSKLIFACVALGGAVLATGVFAAGRVYENPSHDPANWTWNVPDPVKGVRHGEVHSVAMNRTVGYNIYLPPGYESAPERRYPVVYFLHGATGTEKSDCGFARIVAAEISAGTIGEVIYVFPNGGARSRYADWPDENVKAETWIMKELIPHIDAEYRTIGTAAARAVTGFSMGGDGSVRLATKYPGVFCAAASMAGAFGWNVDDASGEKDTAFRWSSQHTERLKDRLALKFVCGSADRLLNNHHRFLAHLDELKLGYVYTVHPEVGHNLGKLTELSGPEIIRWLATKYQPATE